MTRYTRSEAPLSCLGCSIVAIIYFGIWGAMLAGAVWIVVSVLQFMNVI